MRRAVWVMAVLLLAATAVGQDGGSDGPREIDACGVLVQGAGCVLFAGGGGQYVLSEYRDFRIGDAVRVVGTVDPNCTTICGDADGCIRGAQVYDARVYPCGTPLPDFPADLVGNLCTAASGALAGLGAAGLFFVRRRRVAWDRRTAAPRGSAKGALDGRQQPRGESGRPSRAPAHGVRRGFAGTAAGCPAQAAAADAARRR